MDETAESTLRARCREAFGDDRRLAFWHATTGGKIDRGVLHFRELHFRDDVREAWGDTDEARTKAAPVIDDTSLDRLGDSHCERIHAAGDLRCTTRVFEEAVAMHVGAGDHGRIVNSDPAAEVDQYGFVTATHERLERADRAQP
jgi:hypothetical protein